MNEVPYAAGGQTIDELVRQGGVQVRRVSKQHIGMLARDQALMRKYERMAAGLPVLKLAGDPRLLVADGGR